MRVDGVLEGRREGKSVVDDTGDVLLHRSVRVLATFFPAKGDARKSDPDSGGEIEVG